MKPVRPIRIDGDIAIITLTQGYETVIDLVDMPLIDGANWVTFRSRNTFYAYRNITVDGKQTTFFLHRVLMQPKDGLHVDHIDGDGLNNRRSNLRLATIAQNQHNSGMRVNNKSGFKGVSWYKSRRKWRAQIKVNKRHIYLGLFSTKEDAGAAYARASAKYHGEFARTA